jgi:glycosyltransferase involved in cell wall biosynthesis
MAWANRLFNYYRIIDDAAEQIYIHNLIIGESKEIYTHKTLREINCTYSTIGYGKSVLSFCLHIFMTYHHLLKRKRKNHANLLLFYGYPSVRNFHLLLFSKLLGYKIIIDIVEDITEIKTYKNFKNKIKVKSSVYLLNKIWNYADGIITISTLLNEKLAKIFEMRHVPIFLFPVTVDFNNFSSTGSTRTPSEKVKIFYGGSFGEKDGLPFLLKALSGTWKQFKNIELNLTGLGDRSDMEKFFDLVSELNIGEIVKYHGFLERERYYRILNSCDIFCMTRINSKYANAGFPFKLGEFLATGKPVISTKVGDVTNYLNDKEAILISPESEQEIENALKRILKDPRKYQIIGKNGLYVAQKYFDYKKYASPFLDYIKKISDTSV